MASETKSHPDSPQEPQVHGIDVSALTQCAHWNSKRDIIAIKHKCCDQYYACISCHDALAHHPPQVWPRHERQSKAVLCGSCRAELTIDEYMSCGNTCSGCGAAFNPGCSKHYDLYFEMGETPGSVIDMGGDNGTLSCFALCPRAYFWLGYIRSHRSSIKAYGVVTELND